MTPNEMATLLLEQFARRAWDDLERASEQCRKFSQAAQAIEEGCWRRRAA